MLMQKVPVMNLAHDQFWGEETCLFSIQIGTVAPTSSTHSKFLTSSALTATSLHLLHCWHWQQWWRWTNCWCWGVQPIRTNWFWLLVWSSLSGLSPTRINKILYDVRDVEIEVRIVIAMKEFLPPCLYSGAQTTKACPDFSHSILNCFVEHHFAK